MSDSEHKMIEILRILDENDKVTGSKIIAKELQNRGFSLGERAVRYHLKILDERGFTKRIGYSGRIITDLGREELNKGLIYDQVDFIFSKSEEMIYHTYFDFENQDGNIITSQSNFVCEKEIWDIIKQGFQAGLAISPYIKWGKKQVENKQIIEINTISATTINGILLSNGIISQLIYSGLLEVEDNIPKQFSHLISFKNTSISPLESFTTNKMTSIGDVLETGTGIIPANFSTIPINSKEKALNILNKLKKRGIDGVLSIGENSEDVLGISVNEGMFAIVIIGGVTPICLAYEKNHDVEIKSGSNIIKYSDLNQITDIKKQIIKKGRYNINQKVQFILSKAWNLFRKVDFDIETGDGKLITNISTIKKENLDKSLDIMTRVYKSLPSYISPYYNIIDNFSDNDEVGIATICSLSLDGILLNNGILSTPKYGGLLEMTSNPKFVELISYSGSSLDPHVIYISKNMTSVSKNKNGYKSFLSSIKEVPVVAREDVNNLIIDIQNDIGIPIYKIGKPRELVYNTKIDAYNFAIVTGSGLNPIAAIKEEGIDVKIKAVESLETLSKMETLK
jgi:repressor of nif and glnA expression